MQITREMKKYSRKRQTKHRDLVCKYAGKIVMDYPDFKGTLCDRAIAHDISKSSPEECKPFILIDWGHNKGCIVFTRLMRDGVEAHYLNNRHHPEHFTNLGDMTELDIAEMVCDWCAAAEERKEDVRVWVYENRDTRWDFCEIQVVQINNFIESCLKR